MLDSGELGELRRFHCVTGDHVPPTPDYIPHSGGIFLDANVHDFDIIRWVTGREVVEVYTTGSARAWPSSPTTTTSPTRSRSSHSTTAPSAQPTCPATTVRATR
nr:Gfo/Idh/MocA family oxidoreductase [Tessaracoccus coleopterorum]